MAATLRTYLNSRRVTSTQYNLVGMNQHLGKYYISDEDYPTFLQLYDSHVFSNHSPAHLLERHAPDASPILIDLDFRYSTETSQRVYTADSIKQFVGQYASLIHTFIDRGNDELRFYVQETPGPRIEKGVLKDGIHIVCPDIRMRYDDIFKLRILYLREKHLSDCFSYLANTPEDCFDISVIQRNNWFLYGSSKTPERQPYIVSRCFVLDPDGSVAEEPTSSLSPTMLLTMFSIHNTTPSDYSVRPEKHQEWDILSLSAPPPSAPPPPSLPPPSHPEDNASVLSERINDIINYEGLVWNVTQNNDGFKLTHNSKRCLVVPNHEHSDLNHSCLLVSEHCANLHCYSHPLKRLPKKVATALWKYLTPSNDDRYDTLKTAFEQNVFRVLDPPGYMVRICNKWVHYTRTQLIDMNSGIFIDDDKKKRFIDEWFRDDSIRTYARMEYIVDSAECPPQIFNTFEGFNAAKLAPTLSGDISPVLHQLRIVANHDEAAYEFILDWLASCVQRPGKLNHVCLVVVGIQGTGKDIIFQWFGDKIIGKEAYYNTSRTHIDLFGAFNSSRMNRVFYKIEEGNNHQITGENVEQFKNYITDAYASIQQKGKDTTELCRNYNHFLITSNNKSPFHINVNERRFFAVRCSDEKVKNFGYFKHLAEDILTQEGVIRSFYDFLMSRNISSRDWLNPPATDALTSWKSECMPILHPFVDWFSATVEKPITIKASELYSKYQDWCIETEEEPLSVRNFGVELQKIHNVQRHHTKICNVFTIS